MFINTWGDIFTASLQGLWGGFMESVPRMLGGIVVFLVGWFVAVVVGKLVMDVIDAIKVDKVLASAGFDEVVGRAGYKLHVGAFIGELVKWFIIVAFLVTSLGIVHLTEVNDFLTGTLLPYIPQIIIAALILMVAAVVADALGKFVAASARAAGVGAANFTGVVARYAVWVFAFATALSKLGVFAYFGEIMFGGIVLTLSLAFGLAFGLGGKEAAARALEKFRSHSSPESK